MSGSAFGVSVPPAPPPPVLALPDGQLSSAQHWSPAPLDYSSLQDSIQESLQVLVKILAIQKSGDLNRRALEWVTIMRGLGACCPLAWLAGGGDRGAREGGGLGQGGVGSAFLQATSGAEVARPSLMAQVFSPSSKFPGCC